MGCSGCQQARLRKKKAEEFKSAPQVKAKIKSTTQNAHATTGDNGLSGGAIAAIVISSVALFLILVYFIVRIYRNKSNRHKFNVSRSRAKLASVMTPASLLTR